MLRPEEVVLDAEDADITDKYCTDRAVLLPGSNIMGFCGKLLAIL